MKSLLFVFVSLILWCQVLYGQKYDYNWVTGIPTSTSAMFKFSDDGTIDIDTIVPIIQRGIGSVTISDYEGAMRFYTNGNYIADSSHQLMLNSLSLNDKSPFSGSEVPPYFDYCNYCYQVIPDGYQKGIFYLIHPMLNVASIHGYYLESSYLMISKIDIERNHGHGEVLYKNRILLNEKTSPIFNTIQHANGKDWWVLSRSLDGRYYHKTLLKRDTVIANTRQFNIDPAAYLISYADSVHTSQFGFDVSVSGNYVVENIGPVFHRLLSFDRCSGELSSLKSFAIPTETFPGRKRVTGVGQIILAPNDEFAYGWSVNGLYQWDMTNDDISKSRRKIFGPPLEIDFNEREIDSPIGFLPAVYSPDGKLRFIYGLNHYVVHNPNEPWTSINVEGPRSLPVRFYIKAPNYPNYRLGPLKGSPCDTLISSSPDRFKSSRFTLYPNPTAGPVTVELDLPEWGAEDVYLSIRDAIGREVYKQSVPRWSYRHEIETGGFPAGTYFVSLEMSGAVVHTERIVVY